MDTYKGRCYGGPLAGREAESRFPKGFLLVDKPTGDLWIYEWNPEKGTFHSRQEEPMPALNEGPKNRYRAAEEANYDVLAAPWGGGVPNGDAS